MLFSVHILDTLSHPEFKLWAKKHSHVQTHGFNIDVFVLHKATKYQPYTSFYQQLNLKLENSNHNDPIILQLAARWFINDWQLQDVQRKCYMIQISSNKNFAKHCRKILLTFSTLFCTSSRFNLVLSTLLKLAGTSCFC